MGITESDKIPVLLVDDRPENLVALEALLEDMMLDMFKASSGNEALRLSLKHDFAIVLMDVQMPDMDGFETAELLRANPKTSRVPIIFVTAAMKDSEHQFKGYETGAFDYLLKPIEPAVLRSKMRVFCDLYQQRRSIEMHDQQLATLVNERTAELNATLESLRESEGRFRELLASVTSYMYTVVMDSGRVVSTTHGPGCLSVTGFSAEEYAADRDLWYRMILPEDRQAVLDAAQHILMSKTVQTFEHRIQHKDGSIRWVETTLVPHMSPDGLLLSYDGVIIDITARKQAEAEREQFLRFFQTSGDIMVIADPNGAFLKTNPACTELLGYTTAELVAKPFVDFIHPDDKQPTLDEMVRQQQVGSSLNFENRYRCKDGAYRWLSWRATFVQAEGITYATARDVTERKQAEEQIQRSLKEKEVMLKEIHHRVKNNMQVIYSLLNLQAKGIADTTVRAMFEESQNRISSMALIHEKLYRSKDMAHVDFKDYLKNLVQGIANTFKRNDVQINIEMESILLDVNTGIPCGLMVNELVSNSLKHAFPGGRTGTIRLGINRNGAGNNVLFAEDNGIGFPANVDFHKTSSLGLQLVNVLTGQIHGTVELVSVEGTAFRITFPASTSSLAG